VLEQFPPGTTPNAPVIEPQNIDIVDEQSPRTVKKPTLH
jgi:hypothetical protein